MKYKINDIELGSSQVSLIEEVVDCLRFRLEVNRFLHKKTVENIFKNTVFSEDNFGEVKIGYIVRREITFDIFFAIAFYEVLNKLVNTNSEEEEFHYAKNWLYLSEIFFNEYKLEIELI